MGWFFLTSSSKLQVFSVTYLHLPLKRDDPFCDPVNLGGPVSVENGYLLLPWVEVIVDSNPWQAWEMFKQIYGHTSEIGLTFQFAVAMIISQTAVVSYSEGLLM